MTRIPITASSAVRVRTTPTAIMTRPRMTPTNAPPSGQDEGSNRHNSIEVDQGTRVESSVHSSCQHLSTTFGSNFLSEMEGTGIHLLSDFGACRSQSC